jgi:hypothetical protein
MHRPGIMAPPDLYDVPAKPGVMSADLARAEPVDLRIFLWAVAGVLTAVELWLELAAT